MPRAIGQRFGQLVFASAVFDASIIASLAGARGYTPALTVDDVEWGLCEGRRVRVHGVNFPPSGQYRVSFDDTPFITGAPGSDGSFSALITIPPAAGGWHAISATDTVQSPYHAEVSRLLR